MIISITKEGRVFQAYKEISIGRTVIIEIYELIKNKSPFGDYYVTSHKYITSRGTQLDFNTTLESDVKLTEAAKEIINQIGAN